MGSWNLGILAEIFQKRSTIKLMKKCEKSGRRGELGLSENVKIMEYHGIPKRITFCPIRIGDFQGIPHLYHIFRHIELSYHPGCTSTTLVD
jgi:hypothetical protein